MSICMTAGLAGPGILTGTPACAGGLPGVCREVARAVQLGRAGTRVPDKGGRSLRKGGCSIKGPLSLISWAFPWLENLWIMWARICLMILNVLLAGLARAWFSWLRAEARPADFPALVLVTACLIGAALSGRSRRYAV